MEPRTPARRVRRFSVRAIWISAAFGGCLAFASCGPKLKDSSDLPSAPESGPPFSPGERLSYKIKWGVFPVGSAVMEVGQPVDLNGTLCDRLVFSVRTNAFADKFYKVRTRAESIVAPGFARTLRYRKSQQEGKTKREVLVEYDYDRLLASYFNLGKLERETVIPAQTFDPLAIAFLFRLKQPRPGEVCKLPTCDGKKFREVEVKVGESETVRTLAGKYQTLPVLPAMENLSGVFKKSPDGLLRVWYSNDHRRIPVKISSKVVVGSFTAKLQRVQNDGSERPSRLP